MGCKLICVIRHESTRFTSVILASALQSMMAKWFKAGRKLRIGIVQRLDASLIAMNMICGNEHLKLDAHFHRSNSNA